jgi:predicted phosphoribosyltransferase
LTRIAAMRKWRMHHHRFQDRAQAGQMLAAELSRYAGRDDVLVLGLPRGGVPVATEVARALSAPLDVLIVRKLGVPGWEELAMGAIASGGVRVLNEAVVRAESIPDEVIDEVSRREMKELRRREAGYRGRTGAPDVAGKTVIVVDDGIATGATLKAAVLALSQQAPSRLVIAVPVTSPDARAALEPLVDAFVALRTPSDFRAVGQWYADFSHTTDDEVRRLLAHAEGAEPTADP